MALGILHPCAMGLLAVTLAACASDRRTTGVGDSARAVGAASASPTTNAAPASGACGFEPTLATGSSEHRLTSGAVERRFVSYLPASAERRTALPLVLNLHGSGGTPEGQMETSGLAALAERERFIIVAAASSGARWNVPPDANKPDDVRFIAETLDAVIKMACVDPQRIYATGFSGGARMSSQLACDLSERIAAIAAIGGIRFPGPCARARSMPILAFHGTADSVNPYAGGGEPYWGTSVESAIDGWGSHNGCGTRRETSVAPNVDQLAYGGGACADVVLYRIAGFEHAWPAVIYPDRAEGTANELLWAFFEEHPLPASP